MGRRPIVFAVENFRLALDTVCRREIRVESASLLGVLTARASLRGWAGQDRPAAFVAVDDGLSQHAADQAAAAPPAARAGADAGSFAHLFEGLGPGLNRFEHGAPADLVAQTGRLESVDDRLFFALLLLLVDSAPPRKKFFSDHFNIIIDESNYFSPMTSEEVSGGGRSIWRIRLRPAFSSQSFISWKL